MHVVDKFGIFLRPKILIWTNGHVYEARSLGDTGSASSVGFELENGALTLLGSLCCHLLNIHISAFCHLQLFSIIRISNSRLSLSLSVSSAL